MKGKIATTVVRHTMLDNRRFMWLIFVRYRPFPFRFGYMAQLFACSRAEIHFNFVCSIYESFVSINCTDTVTNRTDRQTDNRKQTKADKRKTMENGSYTSIVWSRLKYLPAKQSICTAGRRWFGEKGEPKLFSKLELNKMDRSIRLLVYSQYSAYSIEKWSYPRGKFS